jgi:uncharacterized protein (DUF1501 family)
MSEDWSGDVKGANTMLHLEGKKGVQTCDGLSRRDFLRAGAVGAGAVGLTLADLAGLNAADFGDRRSCILLFLVGGPGQLDTWDLKPHAPSEVRGPFRPRATNVPGVQVSEHFPRLAGMADRFALVRSVHHDAAPIHETGHQLMQTGRLCRGGREYPNYGAAVSHLRGARSEGVPPWVVLPAPLGNTGVSVSHGQTAGFLGPRHDPVVLHGDPAYPNDRPLVATADAAHRAFDSTPASEAATLRAFDRLFSPAAKKALDLGAEPEALRTRYGSGTFGQSCLLARRLVEAGVRLVTVNMFDTVFNEITWDCHADGGALAGTLDDYRDTLCPMLDAACATLLGDLEQRGLLETTLVVAMGEFGRTPQLNPRGGRDHWPGCWSILLAGGGVCGGRVVGSSDAVGGEPRDRPVRPAEVAASVFHSLGLDPRTSLPGPDDEAVPLADAEPIWELFRG